MANGLAKSIREYVDAKLEKALRSQTVKRMAEVTRVSDDGTVWVSYPGGETESPASTLSSVREGDTVSVEISRGRATVTGNLSDPSAGSASVVGVEEKTVKVNRALETYKEVTTDKLAATDAKIVNIEADTAKVHDLTADSLAAATGYIADLSAGEVTAQDIIADKAKLAQVDVGQITADHATVERLDADHVTVSDFQAEQAKVGQLQADTADLGAIRANSAKVKDLTADQLATAIAYVEYLDAEDITAETLTADIGKVHDLTAEQLSAATAYIAALTAGSVTAQAIIADHGDFSTVKANAAKVANLTTANLEAAVGYIGDLSTANVTAANIVADHAKVGTIDSTYATIANLDSATARIGELESDHVKVSDFEAEQANIDNLQAATADIATIRANSAKVANLTAAELEADHATIGTLETNYAKADMANVSNAWIERGTVKDGAITNAMINDVSANKLTAGTIDASNITVTNLNADNITAGTLNGQRIGEGSLSLDKLSEDVYTEQEVDGLLDTMQKQIDGAIETWTGTAVPTLSNAPAKDWKTAAVRDTHVGDVYFVVNSESQQNGYNYRFTKTGSSYSWQLIKDNDVTQALKRLTDAEGKITSIESFDETVSSHMTNTDTELSSLKTRSTNLETRMTDAESDISEKVDTTTFNTVSQKVDENSSSITSLSTRVETTEQRGMEYIVGTQTASTNAWTGATKDKALYTGKTIAYKLPYAGTSSAATLNLTLSGGGTTGAKALRRNNSTVTTQFAAGSVLQMTYDGTYWRVTGMGSDTTTNYYDRRRHSGAILAKDDVAKQTLIGGTSDGYSQLEPGLEFDMRYPVLYASSAIAANATTTDTYEAGNGVDYDNTATVQSGAANKMLWLKGTVTGDKFKVAPSNFLTTVEPSTEDGSHYIPLGIMTSATGGYFATSRDLYAYVGDSFQRVDVGVRASVTTLSTTVNTVKQTADSNTASITNLTTTVGGVKNLSPFYSVPLDDRSYWFGDGQDGEEIGDGWISESDCYDYVDVNNISGLKAGLYTLLVEVEDHDAVVYFTGGGSATQLNIDRKYDELTLEKGTKTRIPVECVSPNASALMSCNVACAGKVRVSLYEGDYLGPYVPYTSYGMELETVSNRASQIEQDLSGFKTTVSGTYATKTALKATDDKIAPISERVSQAESTIEQHESSIALKANSADVYTKTESDGLISTEVANRNAAITAKADEITSTVSSTYATKAQLGNTQQAILKTGGLGMKADYASFSGVNKGECYFHGFDDDYAAADVDGWVMWNGAKLDIPKGCHMNPNGRLPFDVVTYIVYRTSDESFYGVCWNATSKEWVSTKYTGSTAAVAAEHEWDESADAVLGSYTLAAAEGAVGHATLFDPPKHFSELGEQMVSRVTTAETKIEQNEEAIKLRATKTEAQDYTDSQVSAAKAEIKVTTDGISSEVEKKTDKETIISTIRQSAETVKIKASQVEIDGTAIFSAISDDVDGAITDKGYQTASQVNTAITSKGYATTTQAQGYADTAESNAKAAIPTDVSELNNDSGYITSAAVPTKVSQLTNDKSYATTTQVGTAKSEAISAAATDATNKAATAKSEAISAAADDATTKANAAEQNAKDYADQIEVGGRNLILNSGGFTVDDVVNNARAKVPSEGIIRLTPTSSNAISKFRMGNVLYKDIEGSHVTLSADVRLADVESSYTAENNCAMYLAVMSPERIGNTIASASDRYGGHSFTGITSEWQRFSWTFEVPDDLTSGQASALVGDNIVCVQFNESGSRSPIEVRKPKLERGNRATDWTPAPEDMALSSEAASEEQYVYISKASGTGSVAQNTTWVVETGDVQDAWSVKRPTYSSSYPVLFVAKQRRAVDGTVTCTTPVKDDTTTVIDGGHITTGTIDASKATITNINGQNITAGTVDAGAIKADSGTFDVANIPDLNASKVTAGDIAADRIKANVISAINSLSAGQIDAARINASQLTIGQSQVTGLATALSGKETAGAAAAVQENLDAEVSRRKAMYGTCSTAAGTAAKVVACEGFELYTGARIAVKFSNANTANAPTLNVNGGGAKPVWNQNEAASAANPVRWGADATLTFVYDGDSWVLEDKAPSYSAACSTAEGTRDKAATVAGALVVNGTRVEVGFSTANTYVAASVRLNLSGTGATAMYFDNAASSASRTLLWPAGTSMTFVRRGAGWYLTDGGARKLADDAARTATNYITADSTGIKIHDSDDSSNYQHQSSSGTEIFQGGSSVAKFAMETRIGKSGESHIEMDYHSLKLIDKDRNTYFHVSDLRNNEGYAYVEDSFHGNGELYTFTLNNAIKDDDANQVTVYINGQVVNPSEYTVGNQTTLSLYGSTSSSCGVVTFNSPPAENAFIEVEYCTEDQLPAFTFGNRVSDGSTVGRFSVAIGTNVSAQGFGSIAEGSGTEARGRGSHAEGRYTLAKADYSHAEGIGGEANELGDHAEGDGTAAEGGASHAEGSGSVSSGYASHAEGHYTNAIGGESHAEGSGTTAEGGASHAEGETTQAIGDTSHAEGHSTKATGDMSHAEGTSTQATGASSHAEGYNTKATGIASHAQNDRTIAASAYQTAIGICNVEDSSGDYLFIIGNGSDDDNRSNALTVDQYGNVEAAGTFNGVSLDKLWTGSCTTAAETAAKVVALDDATGFSLAAGNMVLVRFTNGNTAATPTLNVASKGAKTIAYHTNNTTGYGTGNGKTYNSWGAYETILFVYTGTYWLRGSFREYNLASRLGTVEDAYLSKTDAADTYLPLSGGIVTGAQSLKSTNLDRDGANPTSDAWGTALNFIDKDDENIGILAVCRRANTNKNEVSLRVRNESTSGSQIEGIFTIAMDRSSNITYAVSATAAFRSAIGAAASSDRRLKSDISPLGKDAVEFVRKLEPSVYTINGERQVGLVAQDVHDADPWDTNMAFETQEGLDGLDDWEKMEDGSPTWKLDYVRLIAPTIAALQDALDRIEELEARVAELESGSEA